MSNLINRQDAIELCRKYSDSELTSTEESIGAEYCIDLLQEMPSVEPERKWIPVSERLPENNDEVLTTYIVNGNVKKRYVETASYFDGDEGYWSSPWDEYIVYGTRKDVIAWMPLPSAFRGEK